MARFPWGQAILKSATPLGDDGRHLTFDIPDWPGSLAGRHIDVKLMGADNEKIVRSYSLSSGPSEVPQISVEKVEGGLVSTYLVDEIKVGDQVTVRGPIGSKFLYDEERATTPTVLIGGGSGIAPLRGMWQAAKDYGSTVKLVYSVRTQEKAWFVNEIEAAGIQTLLKVTRGPNPTGRVTADDLANFVGDMAAHRFYICGPNAFVDFINETLAGLGVADDAIQFEKWG